MTNKPDPDKTKGPGGLTLREIHEQVKRSAQRDRQSEKMRNTLTEKKNRWQRFVSYVWGKRRG